jgi:hypothetical protein
VGDFGSSDQRAELSAFAVQTGAYIPPDAAGMCATGVAGALRAADRYDPDGPGPEPEQDLCPLVFSTRSDGTGVASGVVAAIEDLTSFVEFDTIHVEPRDDPVTPSIDETDFFIRAIPVSATPPTGCTMPTVADRLPLPSGDGTYDTFQDVCPGTAVTFQIIMQNEIVAETCVDQLFASRLVVIGDDLTETDSRVVAIRVPGDPLLCSP